METEWERSLGLLGVVDEGWEVGVGVSVGFFYSPGKSTFEPTFQLNSKIILIV